MQSHVGALHTTISTKPHHYKNAPYGTFQPQEIDQTDRMHRLLAQMTSETSQEHAYHLFKHFYVQGFSKIGRREMRTSTTQEIQLFKKTLYCSSFDGLGYCN